MPPARNDRRDDRGDRRDDRGGDRRDDRGGDRRDDPPPITPPKRDQGGEKAPDGGDGWTTVSKK